MMDTSADVDDTEAQRAAEISDTLIRLREHLRTIPGAWKPWEDVHSALDVGLDDEGWEEVLLRLEKDSSMKVDRDEERLMFEPRVQVSNLGMLVTKLEDYPDGISYAEIVSSSPPGIEEIVKTAIVRGLVLAIRSKGTQNFMLFPRGADFIVRTSGLFMATLGKARWPPTLMWKRILPNRCDAGM